jgi:hypothetical protein
LSQFKFDLDAVFGRAFAHYYLEKVVFYGQTLLFVVRKLSPVNVSINASVCETAAESSGDAKRGETAVPETAGAGLEAAGAFGRAAFAAFELVLRQVFIPWHCHSHRRKKQ